jgi:hypothetical protein
MKILLELPDSLLLWYGFHGWEFIAGRAAFIRAIQPSVVRTFAERSGSDGLRREAAV